jgi:hypothetical protein
MAAVRDWVGRAAADSAVGLAGIVVDRVGTDMGLGAVAGNEVQQVVGTIGSGGRDVGAGLGLACPGQGAGSVRAGTVGRPGLAAVQTGAGTALGPDCLQAADQGGTDQGVGTDQGAGTDRGADTAEKAGADSLPERQ